MNITIYQRHDHAPRATQKWLDERGIRYEVVDTTASPDLNEFFQSQGLYGTPVVAVAIDGAVSRWDLFRPDLLAVYCGQAAA